MNGSTAKPPCCGHRRDDVDQLADFLIELQKLRDADGAADLRNASAGIFSPAEAVAQYEQRLHRLLEQALRRYPDLRKFIDRDLAPSAARARERVEAALCAARP